MKAAKFVEVSFKYLRSTHSRRNFNGKKGAVVTEFQVVPFKETADLSVVKRTTT